MSKSNYRKLFLSSALLTLVSACAHSHDHQHTVDISAADAGKVSAPVSHYSKIAYLFGLELEPIFLEAMLIEGQEHEADVPNHASAHKVEIVRVGVEFFAESDGQGRPVHCFKVDGAAKICARVGERAPHQPPSAKHHEKLRFGIADVEGQIIHELSAKDDHGSTGDHNNEHESVTVTRRYKVYASDDPSLDNVHCWDGLGGGGGLVSYKGRAGDDITPEEQESFRALIKQAYKDAMNEQTRKHLESLDIPPGTGGPLHCI